MPRFLTFRRGRFAFAQAVVTKTLMDHSPLRAFVPRPERTQIARDIAPIAGGGLRP